MDIDNVMTIDKYKIEGKLGSGSFGEVYRATDIRVGREVAIKKVPFADGSFREFEILKEIEHQGLPKIYDFIEADGECYIVMELIKGISLREYLEHTGVLSEAEAIDFAGQILNILGVLHHKKPAIIYRDLKPENIMVTPDKRLKLIDFGAAFFRDFSGKDGREVYGTRGYSGPELWQNVVADTRADIYSVGVILYEMLTKRRPDRPPYSIEKLRRLNPLISRKMEKIIVRCVDNNPAHRFNSVEEVIEVLNIKDKRKVLDEITFSILRLCVFSGYLVAFIIPMSSMYRNGIRGCSLAEWGSAFVILGIAGLIKEKLVRGIMLHNQRVKIVKSIHLTSKKYAGLYMWGFFILGVGMGLCIGEGSKVTAYAGAAPEELWVEMKDVSERKLLLRNESVYEVEDKVRLEIPSESIPDEEISIEILAVGTDGTRYQSRAFKVCK